jgi:hypothetical protein
MSNAVGGGQPVDEGPSSRLHVADQLLAREGADDGAASVDERRMRDAQVLWSVV